MKQQPQKTKKRKKTDWRRVVTIVLALVMVLALILPLLGSAMPTASAATQSELQNQISSLKGDAADAAARKKELKEQLKAIENDKAKALDRKKLLDKQLAAIDEDVANTQRQIDTYTQLITVQEEALTEAQAKETAAYERFCTRARAMEEAGSVSYLSVLFAAKDYSDLLDRLAIVDEIMTYDNDLVDDLAAARQEVEETLAGLEESKAGVVAQKAVLDAQRAEQAAKVREAEALFTELKGQAAHAEELVKMEEAEEARVAAKIAAKQKELDKLIAAGQIKFTTGSGYAYPLPSSYTHISSYFGYRTHPITGKPNNHTGIDLPAPGGTNVTAVQGGVVTVSGYAPSSYGEYVVISHGDGITTLYAHMRRGSRAVSEGQVVTQGQKLGLVGSTGSSTGNHLHFEVRKNGSRIDPRTLFPGVAFN